MESELKQVGIVVFLNFRFTLFHLNGTRLISVSELSKGLGYKNPRKVYSVLSRNKAFFDEVNGCVEALQVEELVTGTFANGTSKDTNVLGRKPSRYLTYEGVMMMAMLSRSALSLEFKVWAITELKQKMIDDAREIPDDLMPEQKATMALEHSARMLKLAHTKSETAPIYHTRRLIQEARALASEAKGNEKLVALAEHLAGVGCTILDGFEMRKDGLKLYS